MAPDAVEVIGAKRDRQELSDSQIDWVVDAYTRGVVADEQMAALAMAVLLNGMTRREVARWTAAMIATGERLCTRLPFAHLLEMGACSVLQPDAVHCGGIAELRRIAAIGETYHAGDGEAAGWALGEAVQLRGRSEETRVAVPTASALRDLAGRDPAAQR